MTVEMLRGKLDRAIAAEQWAAVAAVQRRIDDLEIRSAPQASSQAGKLVLFRKR
jgi:hypothetical protein